MYEQFYTVMIGAVVLDRWAGDPRWLPHPVRLIGYLCEIIESRSRKLSGSIPLRWAGLLSVFLVVSATAMTCTGLLMLADLINSFLLAAVGFFLLYCSVATGDLVSHSKAVFSPLSSADMAQARQAAAMMVGRDTAHLNESDISRATIESVAENLVDGITAPLFWAFAGSLVSLCMALDPIYGAVIGAISYKAINTMDSMWGYTSQRYIEFGRYAAKLDDAVNFLPARISGWCVVAAALLPGFSCRLSVRTYLADRHKSPSPNSAQTEAAFAGALSRQLGGPSTYQSVVHEKAIIGAGFPPPQAEDIPRANRLLIAAAVVFFLVLLGAHLGITRLWT
jgi:adenosylcobinamide-phosphate synthase